MDEERNAGPADDQVARGAWARIVAFSISMMLVVPGSMLLLAGAGSPAQAHHRPSHAGGPTPSSSPTPSESPTASPTPSPTTSPTSSPPQHEKTMTVMSGAGIRWLSVSYCGDEFPRVPCPDSNFVVWGHVLSAGGGDVGSGMAGMTVDIMLDGYAYPTTTTTDASGRFEATFSSYYLLRIGVVLPLAWTATTAGDETHGASSSGGVFVPMLQT